MSGNEKAVRKPFAAWLLGKIEYHRKDFSPEDARHAAAVLAALSHNATPQAPCIARSDSPEVQGETRPASTDAAGLRSIEAGPPSKSTDGEHRLPAQPVGGAPDARERLRLAMLFIEQWSNWWSYGLGLDDKIPLSPEETAAAEQMAASLGDRASAMVIDNRRFLAASAPAATARITDNDRRWRHLEHGCQWVSWTETGGETHSFDPRNVTGFDGDLKHMRARADEQSARQVAMLLKSAADGS